MGNNLHQPPVTVVAAGERGLRWEQYSILQAAGVSTLMAESIGELDARILEHPEGLVLLDEEFTPGIASLVARLAIANPGMKVVLCVEKLNVVTQAEARKWGATEVISRHASPEVLLDTIRRLSGALVPVR